MGWAGIGSWRLLVIDFGSIRIDSWCRDEKCGHIQLNVAASTIDRSR